MRAFITLLNCFTIVSTMSICDSDLCVCWNNNKQNQDYSGDNIKCTNNVILKNNYSLPSVVNSLDLSSNNISLLVSPLLNSTTMAELLLNNNFITQIKKNTFSLPNLKRLDLSNNQLEHIDKETFQDIKQLEYLNLANNKFTSFSNLMFHHLAKLKEINLSNNKIGGSLKNRNLFDRSGYGLTQKVQSISINGISLNIVPNNFFVDAYDLRKLMIANNNISVIFEIPYTLEYLDLSDNPLSEIASEDFANVPALKVLKLNNLSISEIAEGTFEYLHGLQTLELERNRNLIVFSSLAFGREVLEDADDFALQRLSLKGSRLIKLDEELKEPFGHLVELDLQGNPWQCDCDMKWVKRLQIPDRYTEHVRCGSPQALFNAKIFELKPKYFVCEREKRHGGFMVVIFTICIIMAAVALWIFLALPKRQSRSSLIREMYSPTAAYTVLPMGA